MLITKSNGLTPGGADTQVQYNDGGVFGGDSGFTYNKATDTATLSGGLKVPKIYPSADSTTAIQINKADGTTNVLNVDTTNGRVGIGTTTPNTEFNIKGTLNAALTGTVAVTHLSTAVVGTGTSFTTQLTVGDSIKIGTEIFTVSVITDATHLTLDSAYQGATASGLTAYYDPTLFTVDNGDAVNKLTILKNGNVGIGTTNPVDKLQVLGAIRSSVTGAYVNFTAYNPGNGWPRGQFLIGYGAAPTNVGLAIAPADSATNTSYISSLEIDMNKNAADATNKMITIGQYPSYAGIAALGPSGNSAGTPFKFSTRTYRGNNSGLVINNDINQTVNIGTDTLSTTNQLNVIPRGTLNAAYFGGNVGIGTTVPNSLLHVAGAITTPVAAKTAAYTITATDSIVTGDATTAAFTLTLPTAVGITGRKYTFKKIDASANAVTIDGNASETIDGAATYDLSAQWKYVSIVSDGANWLVVGNN